MESAFSSLSFAVGGEPGNTLLLYVIVRLLSLIAGKLVQYDGSSLCFYLLNLGV